MCRESRLRILNGRVTGDCLGNFTFYNTNGQSTIDYCIVSETLLSKVEFFNVLPPNELSDHCIITTSFNFDCYVDENSEKDCESQYNMVPGKFVCDTNSKPYFLQSMNDSEGQKLIYDFESCLSDERSDTSCLADKLTNIFFCCGMESVKLNILLTEGQSENSLKGITDGLISSVNLFRLR